ncbi:hypothetical protein ACS0TY_033270 [Phlomoides rotata]
MFINFRSSHILSCFCFFYSSTLIFKSCFFFFSCIFTFLYSILYLRNNHLHFPSHNSFRRRIFLILCFFFSKNRMDSVPSSPTYTSPSVKPSPLYQTVLPKRATPDMLLYSSKLRSRDQAIVKPQTTSPMVWFAAILCMIFSILLIFFGIATLIVYLTIQPRNPVFDTAAASVSPTYYSSPEYINSDITFAANFSNPNRKLSVRFEYLRFEVSFQEKVIASKVVQAFSQRPGEASLIPVHMLSGLVPLPPNVAMELQKQAVNNRVVYNIRAYFKVKVKLGAIHYSYWLHGECRLEMTSPPNSYLISRSCRTKRQ